jgi:succinate dehydrogenase/fumarate reductase-like Fe-S protein
MNRDDIKDVFQPYDRLVEIEVLGVAHHVPENNSLLRCFQYLSVESISYGDFCWNGTCLNCQVTIRNGEKEKSVIACRTNVQEGMSIVKLAEAIELE